MQNLKGAIEALHLVFLYLQRSALYSLAVRESSRKRACAALLYLALKPP